MKFGNPFNKVALTTGTFVVALMTGLGTVNAGDQFTTEVEQQAVRTKDVLFNQVGADTPESVRPTGNQAMNTVNSVTDAAGGATDVVSITAQQVKAQADAKIADLERKLANAGAGEITVKTENRKIRSENMYTNKQFVIVDWVQTYSCGGKNGGPCGYVNLYPKKSYVCTGDLMGVYKVTYQGSKEITSDLQRTYYTKTNLRTYYKDDSKWLYQKKGFKHTTTGLGAVCK
ncbi:hypothetical protein [Marinobacter sp. MBR-105]|jgi:hypothetical protein